MTSIILSVNPSNEQQNESMADIIPYQGPIVCQEKTHQESSTLSLQTSTTSDVTTVTQVEMKFAFTNPNYFHDAYLNNMYS